MLSQQNKLSKLNPWLEKIRLYQKKQKCVQNLDESSDEEDDEEDE